MENLNFDYMNGFADGKKMISCAVNIVESIRLAVINKARFDYRTKDVNADNFTYLEDVDWNDNFFLEASKLVSKFEDGEDYQIEAVEHALSDIAQHCFVVNIYENEINKLKI